MTDSIPELSRIDASPSLLDSSLFPAILSVFEEASRRSLPQVPVAQTSAHTVEKYPPSSYPKDNMGMYFNDVVLGTVPGNARYDDIFWCCLLSLLSDSEVSGCYLGGPLHKLIYTVYDDFDPRDVSFHD